MISSKSKVSYQAFRFFKLVVLLAGILELTGGEGWRFLGNPSGGDSYDDLLGPIWTKGILDSDSPGALVPNIYTLNQIEYEWKAQTDMNETTSPGQPFIVYVFSDDDNDGSDNGFPKTLISYANWLPLDGNFVHTSQLGYDETSDNPNNFYLLANPHPVAIDFCEMFDKESVNIVNSVIVCDPSANSGNGDYVSLSCSTGDVFIAPFQGFWVQTTGENPELEIPESAYLENTVDGYFKESGSLRAERSNLKREDEKYSPILLTLSISNEEKAFSSEAQLLFTEEATKELDTYDVPKLSPQGLANRWLSFASIDDQNCSHALQSLPVNFEEKIRIPLDIQTTESGSYILDWEFPESQVFNGSYFLRDNMTGDVIELREGSTYRFEMTVEQVQKVSTTNK